MSERNLCVLIDFENIAAGTEKEGLGRFNIRAVMRRLKDKGRILVTRAYGDWGRFAKFKQGLLEQGVQMMELTSYRGQDKNRADIALVVDAMELAFTRDYLDTYVLLSGDSDFTPLVMRLKELNKRVIGIGTRGSTSRLLAEGCDEFIYYENIKRSDVKRSDASQHHSRRSNHHSNNHSNSHSPSPATPSLSKYEAMSLLVETIEGVQKETPGPVLAGLLKQSVQRKEPTFDESDYGFAGFARFLESAQQKGLIILLQDNKSGGYRVELPSGDEPPVVSHDEDDSTRAAALEGRAEQLREHLAEQGFNPLNQFIRHTVIHEFVDHVQERQARKKRNTLMYVHGDIARRCRKTDPFVPPKDVSVILNALQAAGELLHSDGNPVRSNSAHFTLSKDAEELLQALRKFYVQQLLASGEDVNDSGALSELLWGNREHQRDAEELVAWQAHATPSADSLPPPADAVPVSADASAKDTPHNEASPPEGEAEAEAAPRRKKKSTRKKSTRKKSAKDEGSEQDSHDDMAAATDAKKTRRKRTEHEDEIATKDGEDRPRRKKTRKKKTTRKKKVDAAPVAAPEPPPMVAMVPSLQVSAAPPETDGVLEAEAALG